MKPRPQRDASLMQIAAAVVGSAGAAQVVRPAACCPDHAEVEDITCCERCPDDPMDSAPEMPLSVEQQLNTYADARAEGLYADPAGPAYVGANGRRLMLRETPEGLYVGGVLVTSIDDARALVATIAEWVRAQPGAGF